MDTHTPWIAIVDDEATIRRALQRLLRSVGLAARAYAGGAELQADLPAELPAGHPGLPFCAVLDLHMPGMSGLEVQAWLAARSPATGIVFATGQHSAEVYAGVMRRRPTAYLRKPMDEQLLLDAIAVALGAWNAVGIHRERA